MYLKSEESIVKICFKKNRNLLINKDVHIQRVLVLCKYSPMSENIAFSNRKTNKHSF